MKRHLSILTVLMITFSCSEDFLEKVPVSNLTTENFYKNEDDFKAAINAVYDPLQHDQMYGIGGSRWGAKTDEMYRAFDWYGYNYSPTNSSSNTMWNDLYQGIFAANVFLSKAVLSDLDKSFLDPLEGEAHFLRAFYYFHLVRWFGGVPIITEPAREGRRFILVLWRVRSFR